MYQVLTSDLHLGHELVARDRGFPTVVAHDRAVIRALSRVPASGHLYILGDIALGEWKYALEVLGDVPATKHLIVGNHDRCSPTASNGHQYHDPYRKVFVSISTAASLRFGGRDLLLSHYPYDGDRGKDRHPQWRLRDLGTPLLHGHLHDSTRFRLSALGTPMVHVGLDAWGLRPVPLAEAVELLP